MLIDTHAHVNMGQFKDDADKVVKRALDNGVSLINIGVDFETSKKAIELAEKFSGVWASAGFHPNDSSEEFDYTAFKELAKNPKVVAIGEIGLDYYRLKNDDLAAQDKQKDIFKKQIELALELKKPIIVHCREARSTDSGQAHEDLLKILTPYYFPPEADPPRAENLNSSQNGVIHSFSGNLEQAGKYRAMGFKLAFNGIITFSRDYDEIVLKTPLEDILIETDCPFLTPVPYRGQRNEPAYVVEVAKKLAEIKDLPLEEISSQTTKNTAMVFNLQITF